MMTITCSESGFSLPIRPDGGSIHLIGGRADSPRRYRLPPGAGLGT